MKVFWALSRLRMLDVLRSPGATLVFLGLPIMLLFVLALVFANGEPFERKTVVLVAGAAQVPSVSALIGEHPELRVRSEESRAVALRQLEANAADAVLDVEARTVRVTVSSPDAIWGAGLERLLRDKAVLITVERPAWGYLHFLVPGLVSSSVMFAGLYGMGYSMARYRQNGFLKKLATTPLSRTEFILAQLFGRGVLIAAQLILLLVTAILCFQLRVSGAGLCTAAVALALGVFAFSGAGFALASLIKAEAVVSDTISGLTLPLTLFSGVFFPIDTLPKAMASVCAMLPSTLLVEATRSSLLYGASLEKEAGTLLALLVWGMVLFAISGASFKWHG